MSNTDWRRNTPGRIRALVGLGRDLGLPGMRRRFLARLRGLSAPTLIVWGEDDQLLPAAHAQELRRALPDSRVHVFSQCGHVPPVECATDFNRLVLEFVSQSGELELEFYVGGTT